MDIFLSKKEKGYCGIKNFEEVVADHVILEYLELMNSKDLGQFVDFEVMVLRDKVDILQDLVEEKLNNYDR